MTIPEWLLNSWEVFWFFAHALHVFMTSAREESPIAVETSTPNP